MSAKEDGKYVKLHYEVFRLDIKTIYYYENKEQKDAILLWYSKIMSPFEHIISWPRCKVFHTQCFRIKLYKTYIHYRKLESTEN